MACAIIENARHQVLIARKPADRGEPGWEFPGDVVGEGESPEAAARRAARDKVNLNIEIDIGQPPLAEELEDRVVLYRYFLAGVLEGQAEPKGCEEIRWIEKGQLREYDFDAVTQGVVDWYLDEG
jgi:ADP-ribose pyrophosphatase YjhB (NUDIX family)